MTNDQLKNYESLGILKEMVSGGEFRFQRPLSLDIPISVINQLSRIYEANQEHGGILEFASNGKNAVIALQFYEVPNKATKAYNFDPNEAFFNQVILNVLDRGNIPIVVHTHPTRLGIDYYDQKKVNFYLNSSKPDRAVSRAGVVPYLNMPEAIFVKDDRFPKGYKINFYTGGIFPAGARSFTTNQYIAGGVTLLAAGRSNILTGLGIGGFLLEFFRKPQYRYRDDGGIRVELTY